jgi:hypothetical protein
MGRVLSPLGVVLLLVAGSLGAALYFELTGGGQSRGGMVSDALPGSAPTVEQTPAAGFVMPALDHYSEVVERPLFVESRRPPEEEEQVSEPAKQPQLPEKRPSYLLTGVMMTPERRTAFLKSVSDGEAKRVKQGDTLDGWLVKRVESRRVVLAQGSRSQVLKLQVVPETTPRGARSPRAGARLPGDPSRRAGQSERRSAPRRPRAVAPRAAARRPMEEAKRRMDPRLFSRGASAAAGARPK